MDPENLQVIIDEGLKSASEEANRRLAAQDKKLPTIETTVEASIQTNYRQPAQLEQRITEMRFDPPKPAAPKPEGMVSDTLLFSVSGGSDKISNNLWPTLTGNATSGYKLAMTLGHVDARQYVGDAAVPISITDIPGQPDPVANALTVASGDKIFCEIVEDIRGVATYAAIKKAAAWPTSTAAKLIGGDDQTGTAGARNVRLCEIVTEFGLTKVKAYHSGNIAHFAPELLENTTTSPSAGSARVMKQWNAATGTWDLRYLTAGDGILLTENTDDIGIEIDPTYGYPTGIPDGETNGDMLYWDATAEKWVLLLAPPGGYISVLSHNGTVPSWIATEECA